MPEYVYRAITKEGVIVKNRVESGNKQTLVKRLKEGNLTPIDVVQIGYGRKKVNVKNTYMFSSVHFGAFDVDDRNESINNYDNNSLTLKQTYSYDYIGCDDQFVEKYQFLKKQLDNIVYLLSV